MKNLFAKRTNTEVIGKTMTTPLGIYGVSENLEKHKIQASIDFIEEKGYKINVVGKLKKNTDFYNIQYCSSVEQGSEHLNNIEILNTWDDKTILMALNAYCSAILRIEKAKEINPIFNELKIK